MRGIFFDGVNASFGEPTDWDAERNGECVTLPTQVTLHEDTMLVTSVWTFTDAERAAIAAGHNLALTVYGGQPPVSLTVVDIQETGT